MMHRVLGVYDVAICPEIHLPGIGGSLGTMTAIGGAAGFWKTSYTITMGLLNEGPMGQGHDAGPLRPHVLVVVPDPTFLASAAVSALATLTSGLKPQFTSHSVQINVEGSGMLPICTELVPYCAAVGALSVTVCGGPVDIPNTTPPIIPTQISVWAGLTLGDVIGGLINVVMDMAFSVLTGLAGGWVGGKLGKILGEKLGGAALGIVLKGLGIIGNETAANLSMGPTNLGAPFQQLIDGDDVTSDAPIGFAILGFGYNLKQRSSDTSGSHRDGMEWTTPWGNY